MLYFLKKNAKVFAVLILVISVVVRIFSLPQSNHDMFFYNLPWYETISSTGILKALGTNFTNYNPPYTYALAFATLSKGFIPPLVAIKLIPTIFDIFGAIYVYKIVRLKYPAADMPLLASAFYFSAPSILINSSYWGQVDSIYTFFLLACLYYLITEKMFISLLAFGLSFSVKAQAIFLFPFLVIMLLKKHIPWKHIWVIPAVYIAAISPVILLGRPILDTLLVYFRQTGSTDKLSMNAPNFYVFPSNNWYSILAPTGIIAAAILISLWIYKSIKNTNDWNNKNIILTALLSAALTPFLLPKMHDRYFYPADVLSIILAFYWAELWFVPLFYQIISTSSTSVFLFHNNPFLITASVFLNAATISTLLRVQRISIFKDIPIPKNTLLLRRLYSACIPIFISGVCVMMIFNPLFARIEYNMPYFPSDSTQPEKYERYKRAAYVIDYVKGHKSKAYLLNLKLKDGSSVFTNDDIEYLNNFKKSTATYFSIWLSSLLGLFVITLLAWTWNWLPFLKHAASRGGQITAYLAICLGTIITVIFLFNQKTTTGLFSYLNSTSILNNLFPLRFWMDALLLATLSTIMVSIGLVWIMKEKKITA